MSQKSNSKERTNHLITEKSPYLLQHALNPVDWYPWTEEAFQKAKNEDKPIFLSIGYSTCHWCHVMAHESFEDDEVARLLNESFVSIKVDREERPDIDKIYMTACQALTGSGGWPLTIIMTPEKKPFFAATYIPKRGRFGRVGLLDLIPQIKSMWKEKREEVLKSANQIVNALQPSSTGGKGEELKEEILRVTYNQLLRRFDEKEGGFSGAPKFPTPHNLFFLLRYWRRTGEKKALQMVEKTLQKMRLGGIFDHVGFGFHRYSTDFFWLVPHYEKMLYDQALLAIAYTEAYQITKNDTYKEVVREIFTYVLRDMKSIDGGFFSAEDADSEDEEGNVEEGKFYLWKEEEIRKVLNEEDTSLIVKFFNIKRGGNFLDQVTQNRTGENILHVEIPLTELASELEIPERDLLKRLETIRTTLFNVRGRRARPHRDDKVLTDWNGLMIAAFAKASRVLDINEYIEAAEQAMDFILKVMIRDDGRLLHRYRDGQAAILANIDDYTFLIWGLIELYETTFKTRYLSLALKLNNELIDHFWDEDQGGFYFTPNDGEDLLFRQKEIYDGAIPSGNSVALLNLLRLSHLTMNPDFEEKAFEITRAFSKTLKQIPSAHTFLLMALDFAFGPIYETVIAGHSNSEDTLEMLKALRSQFFPNNVVILNPAEQENPDIFDLVEFIKNQPSIDGRATAYVCINYNCQKPTIKILEMLDLLKKKKIG